MFIDIYCSTPHKIKVFENKKIQNKDKVTNFKEDLLFKKCNINFKSTEINFYPGYKIKFDVSDVCTENCKINFQHSEFGCQNEKQKEIPNELKTPIKKNNNQQFSPVSESKSLSIIKNEMDILKFQYNEVIVKLFKLTLNKEEQKSCDFLKIDNNFIDRVVYKIIVVKKKILEEIARIKNEFNKLKNKENFMKLDINNISKLIENISEDCLSDSQINKKRKRKTILVNECKKKIHVVDNDKKIDCDKINYSEYDIKEEIEEGNCCEESLLKSINRDLFISKEKSVLSKKQNDLVNFIEYHNNERYSLYYKKIELEDRYQLINFLDIKRQKLTHQIEKLNETNEYLIQNAFFNNNYQDNCISNENQECQNQIEQNQEYQNQECQNQEYQNQEYQNQIEQNKEQILDVFSEIERPGAYTTMSDTTPQNNYNKVPCDKRSESSQVTSPLFHCFLKKTN